MWDGMAHHESKILICQAIYPFVEAEAKGQCTLELLVKIIYDRQVTSDS